MKSIMISMKPQDVAGILNGKKYIIRKSIPKCEFPCTVYIYCTKQGRPLVYGDVQSGFGQFTEKYTQTYGYSKEEAERIWGCLNGKVVAEFILNKVGKFTIGHLTYGHNEKFATTIPEIDNYLYEPDSPKKHKSAYTWDIDDLEIYDEPKELSKFLHKVPDYSNGIIIYSLKKEPLKRAPQSWCYVENKE